jgi:hypothetical protein
MLALRNPTLMQIAFPLTTPLHRDGAGKVVWYVQASLDFDTGYKDETASNKLGGVLGVDLNADGVAWSVVKPDGNRLVIDSKDVRGFIAWNLKGLDVPPDLSSA